MRAVHPAFGRLNLERRKYAARVGDEMDELSSNITNDDCTVAAKLLETCGTKDLNATVDDLGSQPTGSCNCSCRIPVPVIEYRSSRNSHERAGLGAIWRPEPWVARLRDHQAERR